LWFLIKSHNQEHIFLDFGKIATNLKRTNQTFIEKNIYFGEIKKLPLRLLIERLPEVKKTETT